MAGYMVSSAQVTKDLSAQVARQNSEIATLKSQMQTLIYENKQLRIQLASNHQDLIREIWFLRSTPTGRRAMPQQQLPEIAAVAQGKAAQASDSGPSIVPSYLPLNCTGLTVPNVVKCWYSEGYYLCRQSDGASGQARKTVKSCIKFCVEHINLFLDQHIPPLPEGAIIGRNSEPWYSNLKDAIEAAWSKVQEFAMAHRKTAFSNSASQFQKQMRDLLKSSDIALNSLPPGPMGACNYNPPEQPLRTREELIANRQKLTERASQQQESV
jgi:regulator of replication initiation timing